MYITYTIHACIRIIKYSLKHANENIEICETTLKEQALAYICVYECAFLCENICICE